MAHRVAEHVVRRRRIGPKVLLRVDLHGVSTYGPGRRRTLIRWEWISEIAVGAGVTVRSTAGTIELPPGAFGLDPPALAERLEDARAIERRPDAIAALNAR